MLLKKITTSICFFLVFIVLSQSQVLAEDKVIGEIINVNYKYKIAFTDLSDKELSVGDTVEVFKNAKSVTYLDVIEVTKVLAKLSPSGNHIDVNAAVNFERVSVGDKIVKIDGKNTNNLHANNSSESIDTPNNSAEPSNQLNKSEIVEQYKDLLEQNRVLANQQQVLRDQLDFVITKLDELTSLHQGLELKMQSGSSNDQELVNRENKRLIKENEELNQKIQSFEEKLKYMSNLVKEYINQYEKHK